MFFKEKSYLFLVKSCTDKAFKAHSCESNILPLSFLIKGHFTLHYYQSRIKSKEITMSQSTSNHSVKIYFSLNYIKLSLHKCY